MAKEINEKTFELNITNELLNLSKSFIWYLDHHYWFYPPLTMQNRSIISLFMQPATLFAVGLTQEEESNPSTGGYDVSINYNDPNGHDGRLIFLQYKAGIRKSFSTNNLSQFNRQTARVAGRDPQHALFTFNDAAGGTQHSTLRNLANSVGIQPQSVFYVFPRITEKADFINKVGKLIPNSSFVPVLEIDNQASTQVPPITIVDGSSHKYRTSYDGLTSEVNSFFFSFNYNTNITTELLSELICIQIERFVKILILIRQNARILEIFFNNLLEIFKPFDENELEPYPEWNAILLENVNLYITSLREFYEKNNSIPPAPSKYTTIVPQEGLKLTFDDKNDFSGINYQLF